MSGSLRPRDDQVIPLAEILASAAALARPPGTRIQLGFPATEVHVRAHRGQLVHAIFNLLDNACRVSPPGQAVEVRIVETPDRVEIEIEDKGPGLPTGLESADVRAPSRAGSGYGLLAARRFLEANRGGLSFERLVAGGTLCRVTLPSTAAPAVEQAGPSAAATHEAKPLMAKEA